MVRTENRIELMIKLIFGLLLKLVLLLIWGLSLWVFYKLLYDRYVLESYTLGDYYRTSSIGNHQHDMSSAFRQYYKNYQFDSVKASLGQPTKETSRGLTYGGVTFRNLKMDGVGPIVTYMMIENRDAATHRGVAVGDSMRKVLNVYGRPDLVDSNNRWFYGKYRYRTDIMHGIQFEQKGDKVSKILLYR